MPIYEYRCRKCGEFEFMQRITDPSLQRCPKCRRKVTKLISNTSFQLKGSGWYVTDYASKAKDGDKASAPEKGDKPEAKTEATSGNKQNSAKKDTSSARDAA